MKTLYMNFFFNLPDDFEGDYIDALKEYIKYHENNDKKLEDDPNPTDMDYVKLWYHYIKQVEKGYKFVGKVALDDTENRNKNDDGLKL